MAQEYDGWQPIGEPLGEGGQGRVYLARRPERVRQLDAISKKIEYELQQRTGVGSRPERSFFEFAKELVECGSSDGLEHLGALKLFVIPTGDKQEEEKALGRLSSEVQALQRLDNPATLKLFHSNVSKRFIVTEYHLNGGLDRHLERYAGKALAALETFRPLVAALAMIHGEGAIHRDIKTQNVFVATDGHLVLGDFGIVFFKDDQRKRLTTTYERVGTHFWMAPWAYKNNRLVFDEVNYSLDVFPLGKLLWSMVSGRDGFPYWEYDRPENNLETMFPKDPTMRLINHILSKSVVREEKDCLHSAQDLLLVVDAVIKQIRESGQKPDDGGPWPCQICGQGHYLKAPQVMSSFAHTDSSERVPFAIYVCDRCGHTELFRQQTRPQHSA
jgi:serine/threonine protein kinase